MKKFGLLFLIVLSSCNFLEKKHSGHESSDKIIQLDTLDRTNIFNALFKPEITGECIWKPTKLDSVFPVSDDGYCHTRLDTVIRYRQDSMGRAILIFSTCNEYYRLTSIAIFKKGESNTWSLEKFEKPFDTRRNEGEIFRFDIALFGNQAFLIVIVEGGRMGIEGIDRTFYHLPKLVKSISISEKFKFTDSNGDYDVEKENWGERITNVSSGNQTKILVTKQGVGYDNGKGHYQINESTEYILNDSCIFRPIKK